MKFFKQNPILRDLFQKQGTLQMLEAGELAVVPLVRVQPKDVLFEYYDNAEQLFMAIVIAEDKKEALTAGERIQAALKCRDAAFASPKQSRSLAMEGLFQLAAAGFGYTGKEPKAKQPQPKSVVQLRKELRSFLR